MAGVLAVSGVRYGTSSGRWVLAATILGSGLASLDATVVNIALVSIGREFHAELTGLQWISNGYTLSLSALLLLGGALGDCFGRRRIMVVGVIWFSIGSLLCGVAPNLSALIAARIFQGIGSALMTPASLAILETVFAPDDRARAIGAWSGLSAVAAATAPFIGGYLVDTVSWRLVFLINLPLAAVVLWVTSKHVQETRPPDNHARLDLPGIVFGAVGLAGLTYAAIEAPALGRSSPAVIGAAALGLVSLAVFLLVETRASSPILPLQIFRARQFSGTNLVTLVLYAALGAAFFLLPIQLQGALGYSALQAGVAPVASHRDDAAAFEHDRRLVAAARSSNGNDVRSGSGGRRVRAAQSPGARREIYHRRPAWSSRSRLGTQPNGATVDCHRFGVGPGRIFGDRFGDQQPGRVLRRNDRHRSASFGRRPV